MKMTMKKTIVTAICAVIAAAGAFGQERMPDLKQYFMLANQLKSPEWDFKNIPFLGDDPADSARFSNVTENLQVIDSYLEFALLTYYSAAEKPWAERGNAVLPLNNPRLVDRQLGAYVYKDLVIYRFLGNTAAVGRHEGILKFITDRGNVTRAEIEKYYRDGIRALISGAVDEEFGKAGEEGIVPSQVYADWERQKFVVVNGKAVNGTELIKQTLTNFLLNPTEDSYTRVRGIIARILAGDTQNHFFATLDAAFANTVTSLSPELMNKIKSRWGGTAQGIYAAAKLPNDPAFRIFEIPYK